MTAARHVNPNQLQLFMSPNDMKAAGYVPTMGFAKNAALVNNESTGMRESVESTGVHVPVNLVTTGSEKLLANGHHRYFAQEGADPDRLMPVQHHTQVNRAVQEGAFSEDRALESHPDLPSRLSSMGIKAVGNMRTFDRPTAYPGELTGKWERPHSRDLWPGTDV